MNQAAPTREATLALALLREVDPKVSPDDKRVLGLAEDLRASKSRLDVVHKWYDQYGGKLTGLALIDGLYRALTCGNAQPSERYQKGAKMTLAPGHTIIDDVAIQPEVQKYWPECVGGASRRAPATKS